MKQIPHAPDEFLVGQKELFGDPPPPDQPDGPNCPVCGDPMEYGEQPTIAFGEIGHCVVWTCLNEECHELTRHARWIAAIAKGNPEDITAHIIKHVGTELQHDVGLTPRQWSASMHNLLEIFDARMFPGSPISTTEKLERLEARQQRFARGEIPAQVAEPARRY